MTYVLRLEYRKFRTPSNFDFRCFRSSVQRTLTGRCSSEGKGLPAPAVAFRLPVCRRPDGLPNTPPNTRTSL